MMRPNQVNVAHCIDIQCVTSFAPVSSSHSALTATSASNAHLIRQIKWQIVIRWNVAPVPLGKLVPCAPNTIRSARNFVTEYPGMIKLESDAAGLILLSVWLTTTANGAFPKYGVRVTDALLVYISLGTLYLIHKFIIFFVPTGERGWAGKKYKNKHTYISGSSRSAEMEETRPTYKYRGIQSFFFDIFSISFRSFVLRACFFRRRRRGVCWLYTVYTRRTRFAYCACYLRSHCQCDIYVLLFALNVHGKVCART